MANNLETAKKVLIASQLAEGTSIRAIERITGVHRDTIMRLGIRIGEACAKIHDERLVSLPCRNIQIDEIWGFINKKHKHVTLVDQYKNYGEVWTFISLCRDTKLIPAYRVGVGTVIDARAFIDDLASRLANRVQLSSDQLSAYGETVERAFGGAVDYGQIVKTYTTTNTGPDAASRYSPGEIVRVSKREMCGEPQISLICTSHIEKQNHTLRMHCRRLTRLTNAFTKKLPNFKTAVALNSVYYNFCKRHIAVQMTPAQAAGVEDHQRTVAELVERCGE